MAYYTYYFHFSKSRNLFFLFKRKKGKLKKGKKRITVYCIFQHTYSVNYSNTLLPNVYKIPYSTFISLRKRLIKEVLND